MFVLAICCFVGWFYLLLMWLLLVRLCFGGGLGCWLCGLVLFAWLLWCVQAGLFC